MYYEVPLAICASKQLLSELWLLCMSCAVLCSAIHVQVVLQYSERYSNSVSRKKNFETFFFEPEWRGLFFPNVDPIDAMNSVFCSSKLEPSSRVFGRRF